MQYRQEIDGLRALAVIPVILFHAGFEWCSGGYVGVDVFFVISGYLITSIILGEIANNQFSIVDFYERRARRIIPALAVVLAVCSIAAFVLMPKDLLKSYFQSLVSVATFTSNIFFYLTSGYFSAASDEKPLLHTWSLAVEEQYYIFFPLMLASLSFLGKGQVVAILVALSVASLAISMYLLDISAIDANFYLISSRAWELLFGSIIAFLATSGLQNRLTREISSIAGLGLILCSFVFFDENSPFPSLFTIFPVLGTCLILLFGVRDTVVGRVLSNRILVFIGSISYSLYLWHQPIFAFLRMKSIGEPQGNAFIVAIVLIFVISYLSYKYVEKPFRNRTRISKSVVFGFSISFLFVCLLVGGIGHYSGGFGNRFEKNAYISSVEHSPKRKACHTKGLEYLKPDETCRYFGSDISWAAFGDSHIVEPAFSLASLLKAEDRGVLHLSFSGCPVSVPTFEPVHNILNPIMQPS